MYVHVLCFSVKPMLNKISKTEQKYVVIEIVPRIILFILKRFIIFQENYFVLKCICIFASYLEPG